MVISDPQSIVRRFIADYQQWNDRSHSRCEHDDSAAALEAAEDDWAQLLSRYCRSGFSGEPIAFGSDSNHHPERERVIGVQNVGHRSVVTTVNTDANGFEAKYEYSLVCEAGNWYLEAIDYIDLDGSRIPSL
jgi:hypothetical protein